MCYSPPESEVDPLNLFLHTVVVIHLVPDLKAEMGGIELWWITVYISDYKTHLDLYRRKKEKNSFWPPRVAFSLFPVPRSILQCSARPVFGLQSASLGQRGEHRMCGGFGNPKRGPFLAFRVFLGAGESKNATRRGQTLFFLVFFLKSRCVL